MSEFDETVDSEISESQEEVTEPQQSAEETVVTEEISNNDFSEEADGDEGNSKKSDEETTKPQEETKSKKQTKAENAKFAQKRREQEEIIKKREQAAYKKAQYDLLIGSVNRFTGEEIKDQDDIDEYLLMKDAEKAGFDPTTELSKYQKHKAKEERKIQETNEFDVKSDIALFNEAYPDVNLNELLTDENFSSFAEPFAQKVPLQVIYQQYNLMNSRAEELAKAKAEEKYKRKIASPGSLSNNSAQDKPLSIADMSDSDFEKMLQRAKRGDYMKT